MTPDERATALRPQWQQLTRGIRATHTPTGRVGKPETWFHIEDIPALRDVFSIPQSPANRSLHNPARRSHDSSYEGHDADYFGVASATEGTEMLSRGWADGLARTARLVEEITPKLPPAPSIRRTLRWNDEDGELCTDRWLRGEDDRYHGSVKAHSAKSKAVTVVFSWGGNADLSRDQMTWSGVAALAAVQMLESKGYSVSLVAQSGTYHRHGSQGYHFETLQLKQAGETASMTHLAAAMAHSVSYRLHAMRLTEWCPDAVGTGYGHHISLTAEDIQTAKALGLFEPTAFTIGTVRCEADAVTELTKLCTLLEAEIV